MFSRCVKLLFAFALLFSFSADLWPASAQAATFTLLHGFVGADGNGPRGSLIQASDGYLYGTTCYASGGPGTIFKMSPSGALTTLHVFDPAAWSSPIVANADGAYPTTGLIQASDGNLYGTTSQGGVYGKGTVFKITTSGVFTVLHAFSGGADGGSPAGGLLQASDGNLYGTSGTTVFKLTLSGDFTTLYTFSGADGTGSRGSLIQASDGNLYGTGGGGVYNAGTVFKITTSGLFTKLYDFTGGADGGSPYAGLIQASDGNLYGSCTQGGANNTGTLFKMTLAGGFSTLYTFSANGSTDGALPNGLIQASNGNLYGTCYHGGAYGNGTVFRITLAGAFTNLHTFSAISKRKSTNADGANPWAGLVQGSDGRLYGTTYAAGPGGNGTAFALSSF